MKVQPPYGKDLKKIEWAFVKLTNQAWKMYRKEQTGQVVEAGVQVLVQHDEWADIIEAIYHAMKEPTVPGVEEAATVPGVTKE